MARVADACIDAHHQLAGTFVNPDPQVFAVMAHAHDLPLMLFDRRARRRHRDRAAGHGCVEFLHREVADRLIERLDDV